MSNSACCATTSHVSSNFKAFDGGTQEVGLVHAHGSPAHVFGDTSQEQGQLMSAFGIRHDGQRYCFGNYCSVRLQDAITCARLAAKRALYTSDATRLTHRAGSDGVKLPSDSDRTLMASLGVSFDDGHYVFESSRHSRLADAVAYARLRRVHVY